MLALKRSEHMLNQNPNKGSIIAANNAGTLARALGNTGTTYSAKSLPEL